ncbi:MAG: thioredoxin family protein [Pseudomonadota bacterium]|nr:thioredoxin family protein [Pseudomonadota bacterium]
MAQLLFSNLFRVSPSVASTRAAAGARLASAWLRRGAGATLLAGVVATAFGQDATPVAPMGADRVDTSAPHRSGATRPAPVVTKVASASLGLLAAAAAVSLPVEGQFPGFAGANGWLNSPPLTADALRGKVVLVDIWTYGCVNCLNALPHVNEWAAKYKDQGLVIVGVHSPEFGYEHRPENVQRAAGDLGITFPIAIDNDFKIWNSFSNRFWPALYFVDAEGRVRHHHFGEGDYELSDAVIRTLLDEAHGHAKAAATTGAIASPWQHG